MAFPGSPSLLAGTCTSWQQAGHCPPGPEDSVTQGQGWVFLGPAPRASCQVRPGRELAARRRHQAGAGRTQVLESMGYGVRSLASPSGSTPCGTYEAERGTAALCRHLAVRKEG